MGSDQNTNEESGMASPERKRSVEELQAYYDRFAALIAAEEEEEDRHRRIVEQFKHGVRRICAIQVWEELQDFAQAATTQALADRFDLSHHVVWRGLNEGDLRLENLIVMLTELELEFRSLKPMPPVKQRAAAGFQEAMSWLKSTLAPRTLQKPPAAPVISVREFFLIWSLFRHGDWLKADVLLRVNPTSPTARQEMTKAIARVLRTAQQASGESAINSDLDELRRLHQEWGELFWKCHIAVAFQWIGESCGKAEANAV